MALWLVPVEITEHGQTALVEADDAATAERKAGRGDWEECGDPALLSIKVRGKARPMPKRYRRKIDG